MGILRSLLSAGRVVAEMLAALLTAVFLAFDIAGLEQIDPGRDVPDWRWLALISSIIFVFFIYWRVWRLNQRIDDFEAKGKPRLVCSQASVIPRMVVPRRTESAIRKELSKWPMSSQEQQQRIVQDFQARQDAYYFVQVGFKNDPDLPGPEARATAVHATLEFWQSDGQRLLRIPGRWSETRQEAEAIRVGAGLVGGAIGEAEDVEESIDLPGNGQTHLLDIAVKDEGQWYALNTSSYRAHNWAFKSSYRIVDEEVIAKVTLQAENIPKQTWEFKLTKWELLHISGAADLDEVSVSQSVRIDQSKERVPE